MSNYEPGEMVEGKGIYLGEWNPNNDGNVVYVFAETNCERDPSGSQLLFNFSAAIAG